MNRQHILLSLCAALGVAVSGLVPAPAPAAGPGGVIDAVRSFVAAVDDADREALASHFAARASGQQYGFEQAGGAIRHLAAGLTFFDVAASGRPLAAGTRADAVDRLVGDVAGAGELETRITSIRADCPSGDCSYAVVEFERVYRRGDEEQVVPMRATALLAYEAGARPHFRLFHWHASRVSGTVGPAARKAVR